MPAPHASRHHRTLLATIASAVALTLLGAGCATDRGDDSGTVRLDSIAPVAALAPLDSCGDLLGDLQREALDRVGPYGFDEGYPYLPMEDTFLEERELAAPTTEGGGADGATSVPDTTTPGALVSGTNLQEAGVDEPDLVKATTEQMVMVVDGRLAVIDLTGGTPEVSGRLDLPPGADHELLVADDVALVLSLGYGDQWADPASDDLGFSVDTMVESASLTLVDLSDPAAPTVTDSLEIEGSYVSARMQEAHARVVVRTAPPDLGFVYPADQTEASEERAEAVNRSVIEASTLDDWLPAWALTSADIDRDGHLDDCAAIHRPADFAGFGLVSVLTVDLESGLTDPEAVSVLGAGDTVYASTDHLYVATERLVAEPVPEEAATSIAPEPVEVQTTIHRFRAPAEGTIDYEASGTVEGRLLNQFSLSEHEDVLRVATTRGEPWFDEGSDSLVTTLEQVDDQLVELGRVDDLGRGERIYAVRFVGSVGYVVTFRQTDPLYVIDLQDPSAPTVDGELKILGYSAYLHPIDDTHVLGVGQDADEDGRTSGTQVSLFDVADPAAPVRTGQFTLPGGSSEVEWDHRAFLWWAPDGTAVLPVDVDGDFYRHRSSALVLDVDPTTGISERGEVAHDRGPVRRSVVIGDMLATVDASGVVFSNLSDLGHRADLPV